MTIVALVPEHDDWLNQVAHLIKDSFPQTQEWQTLEGARQEIDEVVTEGHGFVYLEGNKVLGVIGAFAHYAGNTWEMHPLAVAKEAQRRGIGRQLVLRLEEAARDAGAWTMWLGTDDEDDRTTLSLQSDIYADPLGHLARLRNRDEANPHPFSFYQRLGYVLVGVVPNANGARKHDIFMAKSLRTE